ncbi:MAG TPA: hypothetical protein VMD30_00270, partial [Tepidisphaeraceae bacterium]|nr:hypothetical protein [Tepidisphaeraceae bacterium]
MKKSSQGCAKWGGTARLGLVMAALMAGCQPVRNSAAPRPGEAKNGELMYSVSGTQGPVPQQVPPQIAPKPTDVDPADTIPYLASDALGGRSPGSPGLQAAGDFLAGRLAAAGLKPLPGMKGYFQDFDYVAKNRPRDDCKLTFGDRVCKLDDDFLPLSLSADGPFKGPVVFAGYAITDPAHHYDDFAGL